MSWWEVLASALAGRAPSTSTAGAVVADPWVARSPAVPASPGVGRSSEMGRSSEVERAPEGERSPEVSGSAELGESSVVRPDEVDVARGADPAEAAPPPLDTSGLDSLIDALGGIEVVVVIAAERRRSGQPWPFPVQRPAEVGAAQWFSVLAEASRRVGRAEAQRNTRVLAERTPDADEKRLLREVPPHHGN